MDETQEILYFLVKNKWKTNGGRYLAKVEMGGGTIYTIASLTELDKYFAAEEVSGIDLNFEDKTFYIHTKMRTT